MPIEIAMSNIMNVEDIRSVSRFGLSVVTVVFKESVPTLDARQLINEPVSYTHLDVYKRQTLLAMVDASVGGKTGINFNGLKNEIGAFAPANSVLIETEFLRTLDAYNFFSGYAEMLKHGLISNTAHWVELLNFNTSNIDYTVLKQLVGQSVQVKENIVEQDPFEHGIRKALNLGHTVGHAFESMALAEERPVLHGYAVAWGIVCELYLSHLKVDFPKEKMRQTIQFIKDNYGVFTFDCKKYDQLYAFMTHDKKNTSGTINFTLLKDIGDICINQTADKDTIFEMLDFYRECMGI